MRFRWSLFTVVLIAFGAGCRNPQPVVLTPEGGTVVSLNTLITVDQTNESLDAEDVDEVVLEYSSDGGDWQPLPVLQRSSPASPVGDWTMLWDVGSTEPGEYQLRATMRSFAGKVGHSPSTAVKVNGTPEPVASAEAGTEPGMVVLHGEESQDDGVVTEWEWDFGEGERLTGSTVERYFDPQVPEHLLGLTVTDDVGFRARHDFLISTGPPMAMMRFAQCRVEAVMLWGDEMPAQRNALGPDAQAGGAGWPQRRGPGKDQDNQVVLFDGNILGPLEEHPEIPGEPENAPFGKVMTGWAFEVLFQLTGLPSDCKQGQLIKLTLVVKYADANFGATNCQQNGGDWDADQQTCDMHTRWAGKTYDLDHDGADDLDVADQDACTQAGGTWLGDKCLLVFPQDGSDYGPDLWYYEPYKFKIHIDEEKKVIWTDAPRTAYSWGTSYIPLRMKADIVAFMRGTDGKYGYVSLTVEVDGDEDGNRTETISNIVERRDQAALPGFTY